MVSLAEASRRLKTVSEKKLQKKVADIVVTDLQIRDLKREEFKKGLKPDGSIIGKYSNPSYQAYKEAKNPQANGNVDLIDTGSFTNRLFVFSEGEGKFIFKSQDDKSELLQNKYGKDIMGFNQEDWNKLQINKYAPKLINYIKQLTRF